nr:MAG TPA: hypothetical protein [Myoviridae sp. ctNPX13]
MIFGTFLGSVYIVFSSIHKNYEYKIKCLYSDE